MKTIRFAIVVCATIILSSCGRNAENHGTTVPIDSVNATGTAPVDYGGKDPANPKPAVDPDTRDTGMKVNTMNHDDSVRTGIIR